MGTNSKSKNPRNCWSFMNCAVTMKNNCDVFKLDLGGECWHVPTTNMIGCPTRPKSCVRCSWYKKNNGSS